MDFQSAMETFAEAWVAANAGKINFLHPNNPFLQNQGTGRREDLEGSESHHHQPPVRRGESKIPSLLPGTVELPAVSSPGMDLSTIRRNSAIANQPITGGKGAAIPIHCLLKTRESSGVSTDVRSHETNPGDIDDFLIIPAATPFNELLPTALALLGHSKEILPQAEAWISLRNWKPLRLGQVSDDVQKSVGDILHDLTNHATLTILITRSKCPSAPDDLKEKLLRLLLAQSSPPSLGQVTSKDGGGGGAEELKRRFDIWYSAQHTQTLTSLLASLSAEQPITGGGQGSSQPIIGDGHIIPTTISHLVGGEDGQKGQEVGHPHPVYKGISPHQKTRMRTSFDPEMELPRLQDWFSENPHPSRHQIQQYVRELNSLECRKDRKPLDINNVIYWFKNARAAQKRNELRYNGLSPHPPFHHHQIPRQSGDPNNNNSQRLNHNGQSEAQDETTPTTSPSTTISSPGKDSNLQSVRIKQEEEDSVDVEVNEGEIEPRNLSLLELKKSPCREGSNLHEEHLSLGEDSSSSVSPRSSPPLSPRPQFEFSHQHHQILTRFPPIIDHHSFMAYSHHLNNAFPFSSHSSLEPPSAHKRLPFDFQAYQHRQDLFPPLNPHNPSEELISSLLAKRHDEAAGAAALDERRKRNRTFIDPVSEVPRLEAWFSLNTHPSHALILKYTEELNRMPYRQKFPKLEPKNVQFWFKNRRAKSKRLKMAI